ncbi:hypothetical protein [Desulfosporosinus nitroreducens]|uniref:Uncharacterized protein n=1 Tax=Desulfosporosinus nitroreducens TaxID=2018668 RepID=A0ABT8QTY6_9FIRM|nr:hypothetical protein [Desulfosporosinus nitroreducens]MDO0824055.1 hypothetical protein [Desulfosporosinus nitroreducens]
MLADDWFAVSSFLYSGITQKLSFYKDYPKYATPREMKELEDALGIYLKNCIGSGKFLVEEYQALGRSLRVHQENILKAARTIEDYRKLERFNPRQLCQIDIGLKKGIDVSKYADPSYKVEQMQEIRWGLEDGVDVNSYTDPELSPSEMERRRLNLICISKTGSNEVGKEVEDEYDVEI